ncbi:hypothetical protein MKY34_19905 [Sporosarcina sp. FSL K6-1522]|uniref:hypothetical protein n=1 Tax=Sporosarcina sp. FSL K6-1522 TaxID=2921554 RepID=UPI00315AFD08
MKKNFAVTLFLAGSLALTACGDTDAPTPSPEKSKEVEKVATITKEEFEQLENGMTLKEVEKLVGGKAKGEYKKPTRYLYDGAGGEEKDSVITLEFENEKLKSKSEEGLLVDEDKVETPLSPEEEIIAMLETNTDFQTFSEKFYSLPGEEQTELFEKKIQGKSALNWSGVIVHKAGDNIFIYAGDPSLHNGEDWKTITLEKPELMPYIVNVSIPNKAQTAAVNPGDTVSVTGQIDLQGSQEEQSVWRLEKGLILP